MKQTRLQQNREYAILTLRFLIMKGVAYLDSMGNEIAVKVTTTIIEDSIKGAWQKVKGFFVHLDAKEAVLFGEAYKEYLINTVNRLSKVKTLIYRHVPKDLYSFYECAGVRFDGKIVDTSSIMNLLAIGKRIVITGLGGMGKSTLFRHLYLNTVNETARIPILLELRMFNSIPVDEIDLETSLYESLINNGFTFERKYFEYSMKVGAYIILFDGYDEVNREREQTISNQILGVCQKYSENNYFISSRPNDCFIGWYDFVEMSTEPLTKDQALSLIEKIEFDENVKCRFYAALKESLYDKHTSFASNPLLLNIMLLTFRDHAIFPEKVNDFYEQAFLTLFNMHDATKDSYVRDIRTKLGCEDFKTVFSYFCFISYFEGEYQFTEPRLRALLQRAKEKFKSITFSIDDLIEDLLVSVCMLKKDGLVYCFTHRSFQEYFAAWYTCKIPDKTQKDLIKSWWASKNNGAADSYLEMLFNMQSEKVNELVFAPALRKIKVWYEDEGFTCDFLRHFINGTQLYRLHGSDEDDKELINEHLGYTFVRYWYDMILLSCKFNNYSEMDAYTDAKNSGNEKAVIKSMSDISSGDIFRRGFEFDEIVKIAGEENVICAFRWFEGFVVFALEILASIDEKKTGSKRSVRGILEGL